MLSLRPFGGSERRHRRIDDPVAPVAPSKAYVGMVIELDRLRRLDWKMSLVQYLCVGIASPISLAVKSEFSKLLSLFPVIVVLIKALVVACGSHGRANTNVRIPTPGCFSSKTSSRIARLGLALFRSYVSFDVSISDYGVVIVAFAYMYVAVP